MNTNGKIAILPLGATEQHGPHLPLNTDTLIASGIAARLKSKLSANDDVVFLSVEEVGYSPEHLDYAGTLSASYEELIERWIGICEAAYSRGIAKIILLNAHGGNSPLLTIVATEMRMRHAMLVVATSWTRMGVPKGVISDAELAYGIHAGDIETSVMLAMHPALVDMEKAANFPSHQQHLAEKHEYLRAYGKHAFGWKMQDINGQGAVGNAADASAEKGEKLLDHSVQGLLKLIEEVAQFDLAHFNDADGENYSGKNN